MLCPGLRVEKILHYCPRREGTVGGLEYTLAEKLRGLGVAPFERAKSPITQVPQMREKGAVSRSVSKDAKSEPKRSRDLMWLEAGVREMQGKMEQLKRCLVG